MFSKLRQLASRPFPTLRDVLAFVACRFVSGPLCELNLLMSRKGLRMITNGPDYTQALVSLADLNVECP